MASGISEKQGFDYAVERRNGMKIVTNQHLLLAFEGTLKDFHFAAISNSIPTEVCCNLRLEKLTVLIYTGRGRKL